jgi:hypothetical protein
MQQQKVTKSGEQSTTNQQPAHTLSISLKNLPLGTTQEELLKTLAD